MKKLLCLMLVCLAVQAGDISEKDTTSLVEGVFEGALSREGAYILACITDVTTIANELAGAIENFAKKDYESVAEGIRGLGRLLMAVADAMIDCRSESEETVEDGERLKELGMIFARPDEIEFNMEKQKFSVNGVDLWTDLVDAAEEYESGNFWALGEIIGHAMLEVDQHVEDLTFVF